MSMLQHNLTSDPVPVPIPALPPASTRGRRFTVDEYYRMAEVGILSADERVELIDGEILTMNAMGSKHAATVTALCEILQPLAAANGWLIRPQLPIHLGPLDEPEPDIALVRYKSDHYRRAHPGPEDVLIVIEVADSSVAHDRRDKLPRYAAFQIAEMWLIDIQKNVVEVSGRPQAERYDEVHVYHHGETAVSLSLPQVKVEVAAILG